MVGWLMTLAVAAPLHAQRIQPVAVHFIPEALVLRHPSGRAISRSSRVGIGIVIGGVVGGAVGFALGSRGGPCRFDQNQGNCGFGIPIAVLVGVAGGAVVGGIVGAVSGQARSDH